ncbi:YiiX/YebB-like N1pC/P60 family cysteine hydrolase [Cetobacterium sp.]|uniref:YiiX/YebB-like N1pC/P60 family cysteine hydrolase n=1 Tax=Cetobacterium sp. TaxID=2071632 RepID=UPI003F33655F
MIISVSKRFLFLFLIFLSVIGCSNSRYLWQDSQSIIHNSNKLQVGDIILKNKVITDPLSWLGHSSVMINDFYIGDFPMPTKSYYTITVQAWLNEANRKIVVLRYKGFNQKFKQQFLKNIKTYGNGKYKISFSKKNEHNFYCSKFVWFLYYKTAQDLNYKLDLDSDNGLIIFPYDFLDSLDLEQIIL